MRIGTDSLSLALVRATALLAVVTCLATASRAADEASGIGGIGHKTPAGGVIFVTAPAGDTVLTVAVRAGQQVKRGDLLATLAGAATKIEASRATENLATAKAAAEAKVSAQTFAVQLATQQAQYAEQELANYRALGTQARTEKELDTYQAAAAEARINVAIQQWKQQEIRAEADREVSTAAERFDLAKLHLDSDELHAPIDGTILAVNYRPGQRAETDWFFQIADLSLIDVSCQVYEGDLLKVALGKRATIKNAAFSSPINGKVVEIGRLIDAQPRLGTVMIQLDAAEPAARLINMEVEVSIDR
jgi:HlyD family secretion protein